MKFFIQLVVFFFSVSATASVAKYSLHTVKRGSLYRGKALTMFVCQRTKKDIREKTFEDCGEQKGQVISDKDFSSKSLRGFLGVNSQFINTNFSKADLEFAHLHHTKYASSNLSNANLKGALLTDSEFKQVNFESSNLCGANLINSDFSSAENLDKANLRGAIFNAGTKLPFGIEKAKQLGMIFTSSDKKAEILFTYKHVARHCGDEVSSEVEYVKAAPTTNSSEMIDETEAFKGL
ncbi:MAG: pentapeptide repeat-containing protein [Bacteriovoracaceae bacterium]|nr:pentapeptide repeat-containing protein [Bacteriovoracaceae bacterium]